MYLERLKDEYEVNYNGARNPIRLVTCYVYCNTVNVGVLTVRLFRFPYLLTVPKYKEAELPPFVLFLIPYNNHNYLPSLVKSIMFIIYAVSGFQTQIPGKC